MRLQVDLRNVLSPNNVDCMGMQTITNKEDVLQEDDTNQDPSCLKKPKTNRKRRNAPKSLPKGSCLRWLEHKHIELKEV